MAEPTIITDHKRRVKEGGRDGSKLVLINRSETAKDAHANLVISRSIGQVLGEVCD